MNRHTRLTALLLFSILTCLTLTACQKSPTASGSGKAAAVEPADLLLINGYVYTADQNNTIADAVAVNDGRISAVGSTEELQARKGPDTQVIDLAGRMMLPGLEDAHIHIFGIVEPDACSLHSKAMSLEEMVPYLQDCIKRYHPDKGQWLTVEMWNFAEGNQTSAQLPSLRAALDAVSADNPIILWGNDGHHGAVNSAALALATDPDGKVVGLTGATLATTFKDYRDLVGMDDKGEPSGGLNEQARALVSPPSRRDAKSLGPLLPAIGEELARNGITSVQDAALDPSFLPYLKEFEASGNMHFRIQVATRLDPLDFKDPLTGEVRIDDMMKILEDDRVAFKDSKLIHPRAAKIFADGVLEGNPYSDPPTLPNAAVLKPYLQPRFHFDADSGKLDVLGYVDTHSALCQETRDRMADYDDQKAAKAFRAEHGFHPAQCIISFGVLRDQEPFINEYVKRLDAAGFTIHIHAIGDRAVRVAVDALSQVVKPGSGNPHRHTIAHLQLVSPGDQERIGAMHLYLAWTYAWALALPEYDMTVMPFLGDVTGPEGLYDPDSYRMKNSYPVHSTMEFGAVPVAGSDAPVDDRSPRPFINMAVGVTRQGADEHKLNAAQALNIDQMIHAYTINGAHALSQENLTGSIEVGKQADLAVLNQNIVNLYHDGKAQDIAKTRVDLTLFNGQVVYRRE